MFQQELNSEFIPFSRPCLPELYDFLPYLKDIWDDSRKFSNNGAYQWKLEKALSRFLDVPFVSLFANGTMALSSAVKCLNIKGSVIVPAFGLNTTEPVLKCNNIKTIFADVDPVHGNLAPESILRCVKDDTEAMLPMHAYGIPCRADEINDIASLYNLKVIYNASHAFGVRYKGRSILQWGDLSVLSFNLPGFFNAFTGGAVISHDEKTKRALDSMNHFGFAGETLMSEFQSALCLLQLEDYKRVAEARRKITMVYRNELGGIPGLGFILPENDSDHNFSFAAMVINEEAFGAGRDLLYQVLKEHNIFSKRYSCQAFDNESGFPNASRFSRNVLCLPVFPDLSLSDVKRICSVIRRFHECINKGKMVTLG